MSGGLLPAVHVIRVRDDVIRMGIFVAVQRRFQSVAIHFGGDVIAKVSPGRTLLRGVVVVDRVLDAKVRTNLREYFRKNCVAFEAVNVIVGVADDKRSKK